jgi:hypothetical protein
MDVELPKVVSSPEPNVFAHLELFILNILAKLFIMQQSLLFVQVMCQIKLRRNHSSIEFGFGAKCV